MPGSTTNYRPQMPIRLKPPWRPCEKLRRPKTKRSKPHGAGRTIPSQLTSRVPGTLTTNATSAHLFGSGHGSQPKELVDAAGDRKGLIEVDRAARSGGCDQLRTFFR